MKTKQFFFILIGIATILALIGSSGYYLLVGQVRAETDKLRSTLAEVKVARAESDRLLKLKRQYEEEIKPVLPSIHALLPQSKQQSEFTAQLEALAGETGVTLSTLNFTEASPLPQATSQTKKSGGSLAIPFSVEAVGSYDQVHNFLQGMENFARIANISELVGSKTGDNVKFSIKANVFMRP